MPELKDYRIFISHAWSYGDDYTRIVALLDNAPLFSYYNYSAPKEKPLVPLGKYAPDHQLKQYIINKIIPVQSVIMLCGMYAAYSDWIEFELRTALSLKKPIIAVIPWGQQRIPQIIQNNADITVGWNTSTIVDAIRRYSK